MSKIVPPGVPTARERAFLFDLYIVPGWREIFDRIIDEEIKAPTEGRFLEVECGTGGFAISLAANGGVKVEVVGVDSDPERLAIAKGKAEVIKIERIEFHHAEATHLDFPDNSFDFVIADLSLQPVESVAAACAEVVRVARKGAPVVIKISTRASYDEFFSLFWEALFELDLVKYSPELERLITERLTVAEAEQYASDAGLKKLRTITRKEGLDYPDARSFLEDPLINSLFWHHWMSILPDEKTRIKVRDTLLRIIDRERHDLDFDVSIRATVIEGRK